MHRPEFRPPAWLVHPLRWQRAPMPWPAVARGALGMGPLLAAGLATGHRSAGVVAGLGAMFAGVNDRPGTRRTGVVHIGLPALAGSLGLFGAVVTGWWALPLLTVTGLVSGALSVAGPVWSAAALQLLVLTAVGAGMPADGPPWLMAGCFLGGALWVLLLRLAVRSPLAGGALRGERLAVAAVFDALADALDAVGTPSAEPARRRLTAALDRADEALRLCRVLSLPGRSRSADLQLAERFTAAAALCEASVALLWEGTPLPRRIAEGPRRLAAAVRAGQPPGPLPAPVSDTAARSAFDRAVLDATLAFAGTARDSAAGAPRARAGRGAHPVGPAGREYGLRVAVCVSVNTAVALLLRTDHWYWLPATAAFLVKPDFGPLFSRVVNRFVGTAAGVLVFAALSTLSGGGLLPVLAVTAGGVLIPVAGRHFALQTAVITVTVLAFVSTGGDRQAAGTRLADTALACAIVLLVGHLPRLADTHARVGHHFALALRHTQSYLEHVLAGGPAAPPDVPARAEARAGGADAGSAAERATLRRAAYHALAEARVAAETASAELRAGRDWRPVTGGAERIADAATACAVRLEHGRPRPSEPVARQVTASLAAMADALDGLGPAAPELGPAPDGCRTLTDIVTELHLIRALTTAA
ncbi:FUSC family protein [Kitasatospora atroaurantiaca]|uniref:Putative membrane protein YccC n=1 Tax=Kitasatospora atroaurantiaca TaxID=285545 RepID=A0A561EIB5_9ACTN|nr:FUSC family protein [Kitasatospora atroaurantiaca]TWE15360.1 putative membrane protein YccC [Kitasatospora atroaurantiaca]